MNDSVIAAIPLLAYLGLRVVEPPSPDTYSVAMDIRPNVMNLYGSPHGGALAALIDHAGGRACDVLLGRGGPTVDVHIRYLTTPQRSSWVRADAHVVREGRKLIIAAVDVLDEEGRLVATGSMSIAPDPS